MNDFSISFEVFPTIPDVPYQAENGKDGKSLYVVNKVDNANDITLTLSDGTVVIIPKGVDGSNGANGRGITSITRTGGTGAAGSLDTYTIVYTSGSNTTFTVQNGTNGINGSDGVSVVSAEVVQNTLSADYKKLLITLSNGTILDCGIAKGLDGNSVTAFVVDGSGNVSATMATGPALSIGNLYGGISAVSATIDVSGNLQISYPNGVTLNAGKVVNTQGAMTSGFIELGAAYAVTNTYAFLDDLLLSVTCTVPCKYLVIANIQVLATTVGNLDVKCKIDAAYGQVLTSYCFHNKPTLVSYIFITDELTAGSHTISMYTQSTDGTMEVAAGNLSVIALQAIKGDKGDTGDTWDVTLNADDLNTFTDSTFNGVRFIADLSVSALNYPALASGPGFITTNFYSANYIAQSIQAIDGIIYTRIYNSISWGAWYTFTGTL